MNNKDIDICNNDEIDFLNLFSKIWNYKIMVIVITLVFSVLAILYAFFSTPWYKATALVEIGYYNQNIDRKIMLAKTVDVAEKLKVKYIDLLAEKDDADAIAKNLSIVKNNPNFLDITTYGKTNEFAIELINTIVSDISHEHKKVLDGYLDTQKVALANKDREISFLKNNMIADIESQLNTINNITLPSLESKIKILNKNVEESENLLKVLDKNKITDKNLIVLSAIERQSLSNRLISDKARIVDFNVEINKLNNEIVPKLKRDLANFQTVQLNKLLDEKSLIELSLAPYNYANTNIVGDIVTSQHPEKPKKRLIVEVVTVIGFIFSIFIVLIYDSIINRTQKYKTN